MHKLARPTLGHSTVRAAVATLTAQGHSVAEIAERVGSSRNAVYVMRSRAGLTRSTPPTAEPFRQPASLNLNLDVVRELRPHARRRDTTVRQLAQEIVEAAIDLGFVDRLLEGRF